MLLRADRGLLIQGRDELPVAQQILSHADVLAAHRTVRDRAPRALLYRARGPGDDRAVDDSEGGFEALDVRKRNLLELILTPKGNAQVHDLDRIGEIARLEVVPENRAGAFEHCGQGAAHLPQTYDQSFTFFMH